jgi:hypothetical protein
MAKAPKTAAPSVWKTDATHVAVSTKRPSFWFSGVNLKAGEPARLFAKLDLDAEQAARLIGSPHLSHKEETPAAADPAPAK